MHEYTEIETSLLIPYKNNNRKHSNKQINTLIDSIRKYGITYPILVDKNNVIIAGHGTFQAIKKLNYERTPVLRIEHLSDEQIKKYRIMDNMAFELGETDFDAILKEINELGLKDDELLDIGIMEKEFDSLMENVKKTIDEIDSEIFEEEIDDSETEKDERIEPFVKNGDIWNLGNHFILCGKSDIDKNYDELIGETKISMILTDPPYNLGFTYNSYNDNKSYNEYSEMLFNAIAKRDIPKKIITPGKNALKIWHNIAEIEEIGVWIAKNKMSGGKVSNLSLFEPILFIGSFDRHRRATDIFEFNTEKQKDIGSHPCPKTIPFFSELLKYAELSVYDPFLGSGTTLIASEKMGISCYGMELDELYCSEMILRWQNLTGKKATLIRNVNE